MTLGPLPRFDARTVDYPEIPDDHLLDRPERCAVYRFFDPTGALLYVGVANDPPGRFRDHAEQAKWWRYWGWKTLAWYPDRFYAEAVEAHAINAEHPAYNIRGRAEARTPRGWTDEALREINGWRHGWSVAALDAAYGRHMRARALAVLPDARQPLDAETVHHRYLAMYEQAGWFALRWHDMNCVDYAARLREAQQVVAERAADVDELAKRGPRRRRGPGVAAGVNEEAPR